MNSYFLSITYWWWLFIVFTMVAVGFTVFTYRSTIPPISSSKRILLISLRSVALVLLLFAIFEPIFTSINSYIISPKIAILFDNSQSMEVNDADGSRLQKYKELVKNLDLSNFDTNAVFYKFGIDVKKIENIPVKFDSTGLTFNDQQTNISQAIRFINNIAEENNIRAMMIISDGAFNVGNNPIFDAEHFAKPIYTIAIGDTTEPKDVAISSVLVNEVAYVDNMIPVNVNFTSAGYNGNEVKITLLDNGKQLAEQSFIVNTERTNYTAIFDYMPTTEGTHKITASISHLENEITEKNNLHSEYVKVLKNSRVVAIFAGAPSPDFAFIKRVLKNEKGVEILEFVQKEGAIFYNQPTQKDVTRADVFVFCGFPINSTPNNVLSLVNDELNKNKSFLFIAGLTTDYNKLKQIDEHIPFQVVNSKQNEFSASPLININSLASPILRITGTDEDVNLWNKLPPIFRTETFVKVKPESEILSTMKVNNVELKDPLILTREFQENKEIAILGYGLYRWKMLGYASDISNSKPETPDLFATLINNAYRWLSVKDKNKQVSIRTTKKHYNQGEKVEFIGDLYDAAFVAIEDANINVDIGTGNNKRTISMTPIGNGRYYGVIEGLPRNDYNFTATAIKGERKLGNDEGRFNIGELAIEYQNLKANYPLLKTIADRTNGKFYNNINQTNSIINDIKNANTFTNRPVSLQSEFLLWNWLGLLIIAIILLGIEWFVRKRSGLL